MNSDLSERKMRHIEACLTRDVQFQTVTTGLEHVPWPYRALPNVNLADIDLSVTFLGKRLSAPLLIGAMTGGAEKAGQINRTLAQAAHETGIGAGTAAPVNIAHAVARRSGAILPEILAITGTAHPMRARCQHRRQPLCRQQQRRQSGSQCLGLRAQI